MSNFSAFLQDYEYASHILFYLGWIFANFAGCNFQNQLLFTACCLITVGWIKANRVSSLPILFCPQTVHRDLVPYLLSSNGIFPSENEHKHKRAAPWQIKQLTPYCMLRFNHPSNWDHSCCCSLDHFGEGLSKLVFICGLELAVLFGRKHHVTSHVFRSCPPVRD